MWEHMYISEPVYVCVTESNKCSAGEVAEESDGSSVCRRISLQGGTLLHPTEGGGAT